MTDILNQIDAVLADVTSCQCGCGMPITAHGPSPWFANESRRAYLAEQRAQHVEMGAPAAWLEAFDALAAEAIEPEVFPAPQGAPVATADSSPEGRRQFVADVAAFRASLAARPPRCPACNRWMDVEGRYCEPCAIALSGPITGDFGPVQPPAPPRPTFTLADMEEASAAVRARRRQIADIYGVPPELLAPLDEHFREQVNAFAEEHAETVARLADEPAPVQWWRRMLGGER